ncbi:phosphatases II [Annulohypoxylon truncatum]|uniref:phosphatases II n=1 Tax=Annulohypoxylon truncatum TaxID=327061 RepID=UPI002007EECE|nr:phosphatases II [Annulohypoxylon truncatum]KAI1213937.1 phosphatases II [Annulohypoxylon truncatum]
MTQTNLRCSVSAGISHGPLHHPSLLLNSEAFPVTLLTIADRLYLASYLHTPTADTVFPYQEPPPQSPRKRSQRAVDGPAPAPSKSDRYPPYYFTVDDSLLYNAFHHDFGPLHIGHLYRFALHFHDILGAKENQHRPIVFYSRADPRSRANAACLLACYMVLIQSWPPHLALAPIAQIEPPLMPFRDAGYSQADYGITVQDIVYGVWKAKEEGCCVLDNFDLDEYERFERVEHGDFNWITPNFLAFASPQSNPTARITESSELYASLPKTLSAVDAHPTLPQPFKNVLRHFSERNIGLVVRLNSPLYSPSYFEALGIQHLDMIFEDGTCPPLSTVRKFIKLAHETITVRKKGIAVHCKAGLGRTGCLIGAYLIYRHGFTANEIISFMRFMRPGMVVGPQQHWLHINQGVFREWWVEERLERKLRKEMAANANAPPSTPIRAMQKANLNRSAQASTPPSRSPSNRTPLGDLDDERRNAGAQEDYLPAPTPGQPRKTSRADRHHPYQRNSVHHPTVEEEQEGAGKNAEVASSHNRRSNDSIESEEELYLRMRSNRKQSRTPACNETIRSVSQSTTTTIYQVIDNDASNDAENVGHSRPKTIVDHVTASGSPTRSASASGVLTKVRSSKRSTESARNKDSMGVRKTSGRIGSIGTNNTANSARKVSAL